ncbi:glycoside hydrolase family 73 protein [Paenibacillus sp. GCM10023248]|uniref:glycoside hydrolase family 73 protein n=1 Tax=unclassified Paenibacillus TaxID=185978 RepID=UPI002378A599|nr:glycoside hydrolase family 73 protein [Paenibacillus sp. MAHUQ-63]MDD9270234.1 glycoside hydrolase family 73 protein [Paenibacillus sp. MAHUQ-63]
MTKQSFIEQIAPAAVEDMIKTGVLASITIAQACLESAWGQLAPGNNLFGIKGSGTTQTTQEFINGKWVTIEAGFRVYNDWIGSIKDHSEFLLQNSRYRKAGFFDCCIKGDYAGAARALQSAGYATDPQYAAKLIGIIENTNLNTYDQEAYYMKEVIQKLQNQISALESMQLTLLKTAEAHIEKINALEKIANMPVPDWAERAVATAVHCGLIDSPEGRSHDFYSLLTIIYRKGLF